MLTVMTKFSGDIFSNITISAPQLGLKEAWEAAEMAGVADDIRNMPMGMQEVSFLNWLKGKKLRFLYLYNRAEKQYCKEISF